MLVIAMNDTLGPKGLATSKMEFRDYLQLRAPGVVNHIGLTWMKEPKLQSMTLKEMAFQMGMLRLQRTLGHNTPVASSTFLR